MSNGVREKSSLEKRAIDGLITNEAAFIQTLRVVANNSTLSGLGAPGNSASNAPQDPAGNYFTIAGDVQIGQKGNAYDRISSTLLVDDTLDVSKTSGVTFPVVIVQGEGLPPANDNLVNILQGSDVFDFQELSIRTRISTITIKNSGNINTPTGNDLVLPPGSFIVLRFDSFLGEWIIIAGNVNIYI